ncbi:OLC1v1032575C1 [Oldenlandia corymbosa var. corymbosa]|uniref:RING-type E3 ubiquitin transferase n=1 Tax=Oldenlandia corymbosa var. corymbosa TaxID=529605 RepID=A0AAV1CLY3_OLDCO|nr:OLC1v1032575C1 [Oldenlandia corymbosa var. corymbosa]
MMGNACCCFGYEEIGSDHQGSSGCFHGLVSKCRALFGRGSPAPASDEEAIPLESEGIQIGSSATSPIDVTLSVDQNSQMSGDDVVGGQDRGSSHSRAEEPVPITATVQQPPNLLKVDTTLFNAFKPGKDKELCSDSSLKVFSSVELYGAEYLSPSSEDEDVCPTCLEEYTGENPKIVTHCSHHYHLSCIYEWMERSETCPVCGKLMEFDE